MPEPIFMKLGMYIMATEHITMALSKIRTISLCVCMCIPPIVARQRLGKMYPSFVVSFFVGGWELRVDPQDFKK
jgi:hypothetical protein